MIVHSLIRRAEKKMDDLGIVVIDEIHLIGDGQRGFLLELICSKDGFVIGESLFKYIFSSHSQLKY